MTDENATTNQPLTEGTPVGEDQATTPQTPRERARAALKALEAQAAEQSDSVEDTAEASTDADGQPDLEAGGQDTDTTGEDTTDEGAEVKDVSGQDDQAPRIHEAMAKISRAEAASRKRIEAAEKQLERAQRDIEPFLDLKDRLVSKKSNPLDVLEEIGRHLGLDLSYEALTDAVLEGRLPEKSTNAHTELPEEVAKRIEKLEQTIQQQQAAELDNKVAAYHNQVTQLVTSSDEYELIQTEARQAGIAPKDLVGQFVAEVYQSTSAQGEPQLLEPEEACKALEEYLQTRLESLLKAKKASKYISPQAQAAAATQTTKQPSKTLTNALTGNTPPKDADNSPEGRRRRAEQVVDNLFKSQ